MELARYLEDHRLTLTQFAEMVGGVEASTVTRWRTGELFPSPDNMALIEVATGGAVTYRDFQQQRARVGQ
jgi:transcriptional regulator with XRE-family HTH domain